MNKVELMEFFDNKVHEENLNVEFCSVKGRYTCFIFSEEGDVFNMASTQDIFDAFYKSYQEYRNKINTKLMANIDSDNDERKW